MNVPSYDPGTGANVLSVVALIFSMLSYRLSKKNSAARIDAMLPDVQSTIHVVRNRPGWYEIRIQAKNNSASDAILTEAILRQPRKAVGLSSKDALTAGAPGESVLKADLDVASPTRIIQLGYPIGPKGSIAHPHGLRAGERQWLNFYVRVEPSSELLFEVLFSWRSTDVRRSSRHVSKQKVKVPARHID
jgi:hypothetical protein